MLKAIESARTDLDFVELNNYILMNDDNHEEKQVVLKFEELKLHWEEIFKPNLKFDLPKYFKYDAGAQFIVSRKAIHRHSKETYKKLLDWVIIDDIRAYLLEYVWQSIFSDVKK